MGALTTTSGIHLAPVSGDIKCNTWTHRPPRTYTIPMDVVYDWDIEIEIYIADPSDNNEEE